MNLGGILWLSLMHSWERGIFFRDVLVDWSEIVLADFDVEIVVNEIQFDLPLFRAFLMLRILSEEFVNFHWFFVTLVH